MAETLMQAKAIIIIIALFIGALVVFNTVSLTKHSTDSTEKNVSETAHVHESAKEPTEQRVIDQPLGQQPKAIMEKATGQIEQAQQLENDKMQQVESL